MSPLNAWIIPGFLLLMFGNSCCKSVDRGCTLKDETFATSMCALPQIFASRDYKCSITFDVVCGETTLVGQDSACVLIVDPGVTHSCRYGKWTVTHANGSPSRNIRSVEVAIGVAGVVVGGLQLLCSLFCEEEVKQNNPPKFTSCPRDITQYAPSGQTEAVATWTEPTASDPDGETPSVQNNGWASGSKFPEGSTQITYRASDQMGFTEYCFFTVKVIVKRCLYPSYVLYATQTCDNSNIYGSVCSHICDPGYQLPNSANSFDVTCGADQQWSPSFPRCEPVSCGSTQNVSGGQVACPRQPVYPEYCSVICDGGFQHTGSYFVTCQKDASWTPAQPCRDRESPKVECPPNQQLYSGPLQTPVTVTWPDPVTTDNGGGKITFTSNPANGSSLSPGFHFIKITGSDASGNSASCNFIVTVEARKCPTPSVPPFGLVNCTSYYVEGSQCTLTCYPGYQVQGDATVQCLRTELWNASMSTCEAVTCRSLPQVAHGRFVCPSGQQYPAACSLLCDTGFTAQDATFIQCQADRTWSMPGTCHDVEAPQFTNGCADNIEIYQAKLGSQTLVKWNLPAVTDNSASTVSLTSDFPSNSPFPLGVTWVTYTATDVSNNSRSCRFSITVTTLSCAAPKFDPSGKDLMLYTCAFGHVYGATCTLSCTYGYPLVGAKSITCERDDSTHPPTMKWEWPGPSAVAPVCRENNCTDLPSPKNGAVTCSLGNFGWDCMMFCQGNWDVPAQTDGHFYCTNSNNFWIPSTVPDCLGRILPGSIRLNSDIFYYANTCNTSLDELKVKFVERMNSSVWRDACINSCELDNLKVTCGPLTGRKRRNADDTPQLPHLLYRRQTSPFYVLFSFDIVMDYDESSSTKEQVYQNVQTMKDDIYNTLNEDANSGVLNFDGLTAGDPAVGVLKESLVCHIGTYFRPRDNTVSLSCAGCGAGYYLAYDPATGVQASHCTPCAVGSYTNLDNATTCTPCPPGWTTTSTGSKKSTDCKELCHAGSVSFNGFVPCQPCPPGRYQSLGGSVTCDRCPAGTWTAVTGATSRDQCIPSDVRLSNTSLATEVSGAWSALTVRGWLRQQESTVTHVTITLGTGASLRLVTHSGAVSAADVPANGTTSVSLDVAPDTWFRVLFTVDSQTTVTTVYFGTSLVLSYTHSSLSASAKAVLNMDAKSGNVQVSGLHASSKLAAPSVITSQPMSCAGNSSDNSLTWSPVASSLVFPGECDAVDDCLQSPCGTHPCENQAGGFMCHCQAGWTGVTCTTPPDPCNNHQCRHGATCASDGASNYTCACSSEYIGSRCEVPIVNGRWGVWSPWAACTVTCGGGGQQHRQRLCNNPAPLNGGLNCTGNDAETVTCGDTSCPVNGNWSAWVQWSTCSATCDGGERRRQRTCNNPVPQYGGRDCQGPSAEEETCNSQLCPVNGGWSAWSNWTQCSVSCGGGTMSRDRTCTNPPPANGGSACSGNTSQIEVCKAEKCPECPQISRPTGSLLVCSLKHTPYLMTCNVTCAPDYISLTAVPQYTCGEETNYIWSHQRDPRVSPVLPETCKRPTSVEVATMSTSVPIYASCDMAISVKNGVLQNMASSVKCLQQNACQAEVSTNCDSGNAVRRRRSAGPLVLFINITSIFGPNMLLNPNDTARVQQYADWLRLMEDSAATVIGNATHNVLTVTIGGKVVSPDLKALTYTTTLVCPDGSGAYGGVCVECPHGYMEENGQCVPCPVGQYQDQAGSTSCKLCPAGLTWDILGAFSVHQCLYAITTTESTTVNITPGHWSHDCDDICVIVIVVCVCFSAFGLAIVMVVVIVKCKNNRTADSKRRRFSFFALGQVRPIATPDARPGTAVSIGTQPPPYDDTLPMFNTPPVQSELASGEKGLPLPG